MAQKISLADHLRRSRRIVLLALWSLAVMIPASVSFLVTFGNFRLRCGAFWSRVWACGSLFAFGIKLVRHGTPPAKSGCLVISNHLGYLDILAHAAAFPLRFAPKAELRKVPFFNYLTALSIPVWIDRKNPRMSIHYAAEFRRTMLNKVSMLVYPEGTSTDGRHGLLPFKSTPFASAIEAGSKILPTLIFYRQQPADAPLAAWHDDTPFGAHIWQTLTLRSITIDLYIMEASEPLPGESRKEAALRFNQLMTEEYRKIESAQK